MATYMFGTATLGTTLDRLSVHRVTQVRRVLLDLQALRVFRELQVLRVPKVFKVKLEQRDLLAHKVFKV
jgi:hypothetical protein